MLRQKTRRCGEVFAGSPTYNLDFYSRKEMWVIERFGVTLTIQVQVCALKMFCRWLKRTGREVRDLTEAVTCDLLRRVIKGRYAEAAAPATLRRLLVMLRRIGATPAAKTERPSPSEQLTCAYERFLLRAFLKSDLQRTSQLTRELA